MVTHTDWGQHAVLWPLILKTLREGTSILCLALHTPRWQKEAGSWRYSARIKSEVNLASGQLRTRKAKCTQFGKEALCLLS